MSRRYGSYVSWLWLLGASALAAQSALAGDTPEDTEHLTMTGRVFIEPIDAHRLLIAISTRLDASSEHVFLYTAKEPLNPPPRLEGMAGLYYETGGGLRITPAAGGDPHTLEFIVSPSFEAQGNASLVTRFKQTAGLSHYVANPRLDIDAVRGAHKSSDCDSAPRTCLVVAGQSLPFPG